MTALTTTQDLIDALVCSTRADGPVDAIKVKARNAIELFRTTFGEPTMPLNVDALAGLLGIGLSDDAAVHSKDAELVPTGEGGVAIRLNPDQPETRKRFSVGHEVSHTFFPNYQLKTWCRTDARYRRRDNPDDLVEMLCDVGSAELIMPSPWFIQDASAVATSAGLVDLASKYGVSQEATIRRFAEIHAGCVVAVFLSWKLKPTQQGTIGNLNQRNLFGTAPADHARSLKRLRLDYSIPSFDFVQSGHYIPTDKSVENDGPLYEAASTGGSCDGESRLDLGPARGRYRIMAVPLWTDDQDLGPAGENAVGAIIEPLDIKPTKRNSGPPGPNLFN